MHETLDQVSPHPLEKGYHTPLSHPFIFVDTCIQIWPDTDFDKLNTYGCTAFCITTFRPDAGPGEALDAIANWYRIANTYDGVRIAYSAADIVEAKEQGQAAIVVNSQGGDFLGRDIHRLEAFHRLGLRMMLPAYNKRNAICDGCLEPDDGGLSEFGEKWVDECHRLGVLIDLSHVGERSTLDILERAREPVVFTHSNPKALVDIPRAITDEQIKKCAATGGVIGITNWGPLNFRKGMTTRPTVEHYLDAIQYVIDLVGPDHVGMATDMSLGTYPDGDLIRGRPNSALGGYAEHVESNPRSRLRYVEGFDDYGQLLDVVEAMSKRGFSDDGIKKVLGGNWLRVFDLVWGN